MRRLFPLTVGLLLLLLGMSAPVVAQDAEETREAERDTTILPSIAPQEVELRGQLETRFPQLERQPLVGFNPPPRVPIISGDRTPLIGEYRQDTADLPGSPLRQPDIATRSFDTGEPLTGSIEALSGRFFDRQSRVRVHGAVSDELRLTAALNYRGSEGHTPEGALTDATSASDDLNANAGLQWQRSAVRADVEAGGLYQQYNLFGATQEGMSQVPTRSARGFNLRGGIDVDRPDRVSIDSELGVSLTTVESDRIALEPEQASRAATSASESRIEGEALARIPISQFSVQLQGLFDGSNLDLDGFGTSNGWLYRFAGGGSLAWHPLRDLEVRAGAKVFGYSDDVFVSGDGREEIFVAPDVSLDWYPGQGVHVYAYNEPGTDRHDLRSTFSASPFLENAPTLRPTVRLWDAEGGVRAFFGPVQLGAHAGYEQNPTRRFFATRTTEGSVQMQQLHGEARVLSVGASASFTLPIGTQTSLRYVYQDAELTELNSRIPYVATHVATLAVTQPFAERRGRVTIEGTMEEDRIARVGSSETLDTYLSLNARASYDVNEVFSIVGRVDNIIGSTLERWEAHPEAPQTVSLGLRLRW